VKLVIVESPAKAKTIGKFLGKDYRVEASYGHIRDLPSNADEIPEAIRSKSWARMAVDVDNNFEPIYVVQADSKKQVAELKKLLKQADEILLATDEDREGEAISWHLLEVLEPKVPVRRITFHEITRNAIMAALENPREIDMELVRAQEGRRILDRLYGYSLSPVLWKKVRTKLSAGRVQSVAVRLVVEKEEERQAFRVARYCDVEATLAGRELEFGARLTTVDGKRVAGGKDFDPATGALKSGEGRLQLGEAEAAGLAAAAKATVPWRVSAVERKETTQRPAPPFITSTLQQAASSKLKMTPQRVMRIAQRLYEGVGDFAEGLITYMRTDSLTLSEGALAETAELVAREYGPEYTNGPRRYRTQSKGAQEAHEAIRPTHVSRTPASVAGRLDKDELAVYTLIWNRTVASQMADAKLDKTAADLVVKADGRELTFRANGSVVKFPGFLRVYGDRGQDALLPDLREGQSIGGAAASEPGGIDVRDVTHSAHETQPPARYTEASLIKKLEEEGIGRPSTYASVIATIQSRAATWPRRAARCCRPTSAWRSRTCCASTSANTSMSKFTARMEDALDDIAEGHQDWIDFLKAFYRGEGRFGHGLQPSIESQIKNIDFPVISIGNAVDGQPIVVRLGRSQPFVQKGEGGAGNTATVPDDVAYDELTPEKAEELIEQKSKGNEGLGQDPETGLTVYALVGPYGPYVQLGDGELTKETKTAKGKTKIIKVKPKRSSLLKGTPIESVTLELALEYLRLPKTLGVEPESGEAIKTSIGPFGPYVQRAKEYRSIPKGETPFTMTLQRALELFAMPKGARASGKKLLRHLGEHGEDKVSIDLFEGRYGAYVSDGNVNATVPKASDLNALTIEGALLLLAEAAEKKPGKKKAAARKKAVAKKPAAKKPAAKKAAAKKGTAAAKASTSGEVEPGETIPPWED
jgi:DNA topoisomerase-1